jgi:hypothetical protein
MAEPEARSLEEGEEHEDSEAAGNRRQEEQVPPLAAPGHAHSLVRLPRPGITRSRVFQQVFADSGDLIPGNAQITSLRQKAGVRQ